MLKKLQLLTSSLAAISLAAISLAQISWQAANAATTFEKLPVTPAMQPISIAQNQTQTDNYKLPEVPAKLQVPAGNTLVLKTPATGVQIYVCQPNAKDSSKFEWTLKAPEANLLNETGALIGKHYGGPTWEHQDGSKVVGEVKERLDSPDARAIPWLLLSAKSHQGNGLFSKVTYLQRLNTKGGKAPNTGCDASKKNSTVRVDYTADYYYYAAK